LFGRTFQTGHSASSGLHEFTGRAPMAFLWHIRHHFFGNPSLQARLFREHGIRPAFRGNPG
jgi:hypothetical protein